jgi:hypothetical protein
MKVEHGVDSTGLGCYCWVVLQGRLNTRVRIVSAFRPVENNRDVGSVWNQHVRYFWQEQLLYDIDPREQMLDELLHDAEAWIAAGEVVIIGIDVNQNISDPVLCERFRRVGLAEAICCHHSPSHPPATCNWNYSETLIDGMWVSSQVEVLVCGYGHLIQEMMGQTIEFYGWMYISLPFLVTNFSDYIKEFLGAFNLMIPVWLQDMFIGLGQPIEQHMSHN